MRSNWFVGWPVTSGAWRDELLLSLPAGLRPIHPDDLHMTASFLGPVDPSVAETAWAQVEAFPSTPLAIHLSGLGALGDPRRPSALSALVGEGRPEAARAIGALRAAIHRVTQAGEDDRPPLPHVTVARIPRSADDASRERAVRWACAATISANVNLAQIALYVGDAKAGRSYRVVRRRGLGAAV